MSKVESMGVLHMRSVFQIWQLHFLARQKTRRKITPRWEPNQNIFSKTKKLSTKISLVSIQNGLFKAFFFQRNPNRIIQ